MTDEAAFIDDLIGRAYREDLGTRGDITSKAVIPAGSTSIGAFVARSDGCVAGVPIVEACLSHVDGDLMVESLVDDGERVRAGRAIVRVSGSTRSILAAERVALNFLGRLSGIATTTRAFVDAVDGTGARISDTRKTTPGLRLLEKSAVVAGGGVNHRFGLFDAVLIKDNHIAVAGSIREAVSAARTVVGNGLEVEVEVDTLNQLEQVLGTDADAVLLDNMSLDELARAVERVGGRMRTEASGGVTLDTVRDIAETGVDVISIGWLTHSSPSLDVALDIEPQRGSVREGV